MNHVFLEKDEKIIFSGSVNLKFAVNLKPKVYYAEKSIHYLGNFFRKYPLKG